ncbi:MAG: oligopeptide/dipeptide ABC transporter ATP-binding protein [Pseudomonadota bacterium]
MDNTLLEVRGLKKKFGTSPGFLKHSQPKVHAVRGVDLKIFKGETLGLVGESGCGKSTLSLLVLRLLKEDAGRIFFEGVDITDYKRSELKDVRKRMQVVFQNPYASLDPHMKAGEIIGEPLLVHNIVNSKDRKDMVLKLLEEVGLSSDSYDKYPFEFSGGQRQRIGIARALSLTPSLIVADEPVSALDVSIRGGILNLFVELQKKLSLTYLFISHDLKVVEHVSDRIIVMYLGKVVEEFAASELMNARHPYTQALVSAIPVPVPGAKMKRIVPKGDVPSTTNPPKGCSFHPRCSYAKEICSIEEPKFVEIGKGHRAACHFIDKVGVISCKF